MIKQFKSFIAKSLGITSSCNISQLVYGTGSASSVNTRAAYEFYNRNAALRDAIDKISRAISDLPLAINDGSDKLNQDSPFIDILNNPGPENNHNQFFIETATSYLLTEELWFVQRGRFNNAPLAITWIKPFDINPVFSSNEGFPREIRTTSPRDRKTYIRAEIDRRIRYITADGLNELTPIIGKTDNDTQWRGESRLNSIRDELEQQIDGGTHNKALLRNTINPSGIFAPEDDGVPDEALDIAADSLSNKHTKHGAGSALVLPFGIKKISTDLNNRDMDFVNLMDRDTAQIYTQYEIPLPLIMAKVMTMANFEGAQVAFYDRAVVSAFSIIADGLMETMGYKFGIENEKLTFNPHQVKPLQTRQAERMKELRSSNSLTTNEIRQTAGYEREVGADEILAPATLVPIAGSENGATFSTTD